LWTQNDYPDPVIKTAIGKTLVRPIDEVQMKRNI